MGSSDRTGELKHDDVPQEIVTIPLEVSPEVQEEMADFLEAEGISRERFQIRWDTWKGLTVSLQDDELPWTLEEYDRFCAVLVKHWNVRAIDTSPGGGSVG